MSRVAHSPCGHYSYFEFYVVLSKIEPLLLMHEAYVHETNAKLLGLLRPVA